MSKNDFFIAGRWRNRDNIQVVLDVVRTSGHSAYCFIENAYKAEDFEVGAKGVDPNDFMTKTEALRQDDPLMREIFEVDMAAEREADAFLLVLPAGIASHIESGVAYGLGKKCYAVGEFEKTESLYSIFDQVFPDISSLQEWLGKHK
jgi:hypothetical protein